VIRAAALTALALLGGCVSVVEVKTPGEKPEMSIWPFGVRIERRVGDSITARQATLGVSYLCGVVAAGASVVACSVYDEPGARWMTFDPKRETAK